MEIVFIGTGGGRINLIKQFRGTGGIRINDELTFHIDPGPGALLKSIELREDPMKIDVLLVSHAHIDHSNDANLLIEAMTKFTKEKKGVVIGSENVIEGSENFDRVISKYHQKIVKECYIAKPGTEIYINNVCVEATKAEHDEKSAVGFKIKFKDKVIGYTSDTRYFTAIGKIFSGCDYLIVNNLTPREKRIPSHLNSEDTIKILMEAKPKTAVIHHLGTEFLKNSAELEANIISKASGVWTLAAYDGMRIGEKKEIKKLTNFEEFYG